jgi:hypothetical protein
MRSMTSRFDDFARRTDEAMRRPAAEVIAADETAPMDDFEFDDALWLALCGRVHSAGDLAQLPAGVRMYYATRMVESEVGNGGFGQAIENVADYFDEAIVGYRLLGDEPSASLLVDARAAADDDRTLERLDMMVSGPPWSGVPWADAARLAYVRQHRDEFRLPS